MGGYCGRSVGGFGPISKDWAHGYDWTPCFQSLWLLLPPLWMLIAGTVYAYRLKRRPSLTDWEPSAGAFPFHPFPYFSRR